MDIIPYSSQCIDNDDIQSVLKALQSPLLTQGNINECFEEELARFLNVKYVLTFNSATSALYAAYKSCFKPKDKIITTPISFVATANMLLECGCEPFFVDVLYDGNINPKKIENAICVNCPDVAGIVSVDFGGNSVAIDSIQKIASKHNLKFISDSSHAFGGSVNGIKIGSFADVSIFSFHAIKPITTAEGGALATNDEEIYTHAKLIRSHGLIKKSLWDSEVKESGFNFRMNEIQAALGLSQLQKIDTFLSKREEIASYYDTFFDKNPYFVTLHSQKSASHFSTNHLYPILIDKHLYCQKQDIFQALLDCHLGVQVHYKPICEYELYKHYNNDGIYNAKDFYAAEISIPCHQAMTKEQVVYCAESILRVFEKFDLRYC